MADSWWQDAVVYQVYIRSFADGNGDGTGDLAGLRSRLPYLRDLGVDAVWVNPWYPSPLLDGGYDVANYRDLDPRFGSLEEADAFVAEAHELGLRVLLDIVPNHTSWEHAWFREAAAAPPGSAARARYWFRPGRGDGSEPPNDWRSVFGGSAWTRLTEPDGTPGEWYLHLFDESQPELNWSNPEVVGEFQSVLRFWFDRGVDGFRIDVCHGLAKDPALPDLGLDHEGLLSAPDRANHPHWDRDDVHEVFRGWRAVADEFDPPRTFVGEVWLAEPARLALYLRPDELHTAFAFDFVNPAWDAPRFREAIDHALDAAATVEAPVTWVLSNHDIIRHVTRFGSGLSSTDFGTGDAPEDHDPIHGHPGVVDVELGRRRARAALLLMLALPGSVYLYQGEELGLEEVLDIPDEERDDPVFHRTGGRAIGRDGSRVPIPWTPDPPSFGFGDGPAWLTQPGHWSALAASVQATDPASMLSLYRAALRLRHDLPALGAGGITWLDGPADTLLFQREPGFTALVNMGTSPVPAPAGTVLLASGPTTPGVVPPDTAVWVTRP
jgi:alpha-glucosidase